MIGQTRRSEAGIVTAGVVVNATAMMVTQADHALSVLRQAGDALEKASSSLNDFAVNAGGTAGLILIGVTGFLALVRGGVSLALGSSSPSEVEFLDLPADVISKKIEKMRRVSDARGKILSTAEEKSDAVAMGIAYAWDSFAIATLAGKAAVFSAGGLATGGLLSGGIALQLIMNYVKVKAEERVHKENKKRKYHDKREVLISKITEHLTQRPENLEQRDLEQRERLIDLQKKLKGELSDEMSEDPLSVTYRAYKELKNKLKPSAAVIGDLTKAKAAADQVFSPWNLFKVSAYHGANGLGTGMLIAFGVFFAMGALANPISGGVILAAGLVVGLYKALQGYFAYQSQKAEYARLHQKVGAKKEELGGLASEDLTSNQVPTQPTDSIRAGLKKVDTVVSGVVVISAGGFIFRNTSNPILSALAAVPRGVAGALTSILGGVVTGLAYFFCYNAVNKIKESQKALREENDRLSLQVLRKRSTHIASVFSGGDGLLANQTTLSETSQTPSPEVH